MRWYKSFDEEGMVDDLKQRRPLKRVWGKDLGDEMLHFFGEITVGREFIVVFTNSPMRSELVLDVSQTVWRSDALIDGLNILCLERGLSND